MSTAGNQLWLTTAPENAIHKFLEKMKACQMQDIFNAYSNQKKPLMTVSN